MSSFVPTPEQAAAIAFPLADACVVAGAGSGKTAVLTRRFVHLATVHGIPVRRIAALTFTEKAASEMRTRIAAALGEAGRSDLVEDVAFAPISTIHAFCARLLRLHAVDAGLDPAFTVLDEIESRLLLEDACTKAFARLEAAGDDAIGLLGATGVGRDQVLAALDRVRGAGLDPARVGWRSGGVDAPAQRAQARAALDLLQAALGAEDASLRARGEAAIQEARAALAQEGDDPWRLLAAQAGVEDVKPGGGRRGRNATSAARQAAADALECLAGHALDVLGASEITPPLQVLLGTIDRTAAALRRALGALDFTDLEREALALLDRLALQGRRPLHAPLALLVDEMQDTNPLQAAILARLRGEACPTFSVGDPKQSIYRFRRADVRVIQEERRRVGAQGGLALSTTFRARPPLVDALNALTERLFADGAAGVEAAPLVAAGRFRDADGPEVEVAIVDAGAGADASRRRQAEARWIARRIRALVDGGPARAKVEVDADGRERPPRPFTWSDVAILLRARTSLAAYEEALAAEGIPFHTHRGRGFFQAAEIVDLLHALRVVLDPADDHALACLLTGPALAATDEDLLGWYAGPGAAPGAAWAALGAQVAKGAGPVGLVTTIGRLRGEAAAGRLGRVVEGALHELGLLEVALLRPDGARRAMNLRKAVDVARTLERRGRNDLGGLLRHLATLRDLEVAEAEAAPGTEGADVVCITTVHGAKGLEFGAVFLADVGRRPPRVEDALLVDGGDLALKIRHPLEGTAHVPSGMAVLRETEKARRAEEELRLLYVALTRAEERLVITGSSAGLTRDGRPRQVDGWGKALLGALGSAPAPGGATVRLGSATLDLCRVQAPADAPAPPLPVHLRPPSEAARAAARRLREQAEASTSALGGTPFVVTVSELLAFARSPAQLHRLHLEPRALPLAGAAEAEDPASGPAPGEGRETFLAERRLVFDEFHPPAAAGVVDRAALGRALHALLERGPGGDGLPSPEDLESALADEFPAGAPAGAGTLLAAMAARFARSAVGRRAAAAQAAGEDVRREVAFHARVRFPGGRTVAGFDALLVRGAIDLWLPGDGGVEIVDYKTNAPSRALPTPEALRDAYARQLCLYALAAERLLGADVAGARLVLLDPAWGEDVPEVAVDVAGGALEDARRLALAYGTACLEDRWPAAWTDLLEEG